MRVRVGIDTGGTFTDVVVLRDDSSAPVVLKVPSTPAHPADAFIAALSTVSQRLEQDGHRVGLLLHGTTLCTNAVLEGKTAEAIGLIVTEGFRDILEIGRQTVPGGLGKVLLWVKPPRIVPSWLVREVRERMDVNGECLTPLDVSQVRQIVADYRRLGVSSIGISLLHSYANPAHELMVMDVFRQEYPESWVSAGSQIHPEFREYERTLLCLLNASLMPVLSGYLQSIDVAVGEVTVTAPFFLMQSNGGVGSVKVLRERPVLTVLSGPAAGVLAAAFTGRSAGYTNIISFDVGGTSTDIGLIEGGRPRVITHGQIGHYPTTLPMVDVTSIGAGGGSVAWVGPGPSLRVGPRSAGADPGPVCYGKGGLAPTLTDANLVLGRLPLQLAGGAVVLSLDRAWAALEGIGKEFGLSTLQAAQGVVDIAVENMANGIRQVSVRRGFDPRDYALVAFGGAGGLHAAEVAKLLGIPIALIPPHPGVHSALGLLVSELRHEFVCTARRRLHESELVDVTKMFTELEQGAQAKVAGFAEAADWTFERGADLRYRGQGYELTVSVPGGLLERAELNTLLDGFHRRHQQIYGFSLPGEEVELVNLRLTAFAPLQSLPVIEIKEEGTDASAAQIGSRPLFLIEQGGFVDAPVYERARLEARNVIQGPAMVEQVDTSIYIPTGVRGVVDRHGHLVLEMPD